MKGFVVAFLVSVQLVGFGCTVTGAFLLARWVGWVWLGVVLIVVGVFLERNLSLFTQQEGATDARTE